MVRLRIERARDVGEIPVGIWHIKGKEQSVPVPIFRQASAATKASSQEHTKRHRA
jgi:hypothetical protein